MINPELEKIKLQLKYLSVEDEGIKVYLACLKLGSSTALEISKKAKLKQSITEELLEALRKRRLVSYTEKGNKKYFYITKIKP